MNSQEVIEQLENWSEKDALSTRKGYREKRKQNPDKVPSERLIKKLFGTYTKFKESIGLGETKNEVSYEDLKKKVIEKRKELFGGLCFDKVGAGIKLKRKASLEDVLISRE